MRTHWRRYLTGFMTAAVVALAAGPLAGGGSALADPICPAGTHWDGAIHICR